MKLGYVGTYVRNIWKVSKCDAGEGWKSVGKIV